MWSHGGLHFIKYMYHIKHNHPLYMFCYLALQWQGNMQCLQCFYLNFALYTFVWENVEKLFAQNVLTLVLLNKLRCHTHF